MVRALSAPSDAAPHLLVVDDDRRIRDLLLRFLSAEGYRVTTADTAAEARAKLGGLSFDLLILDVMMPGETGFDLARAIRVASSVPILMLTARDEAENRIKGLELGADDYLAKPFEPRELLLRIANILKRQLPASPPIESVRFGEFVFHIGRGELRRGEDVVHLTDREREMLRTLAVKPGETVPRLALAGNGHGINERAVDVQVNRLRRKIERDPANPLIVQTVRGIGLRTLRSAASRVFELYDRIGQWLKGFMPKGLYGRSLLIIVTPMVILQSVVAFVFMERHWNTVTRRLSAAVTQDIAAVIDVYKSYPQDADGPTIRRIAQQRLGLVVDFLPGTDLPPPGPKPFFSLLDQALSRQIRQQIGRPFWIDTVGRSSIVEIRIQLDNTVMRVFAQRNAAYASNSHIFLLWMVGTSLVLLAVAILFLRNQIRPILMLADAAEAFGKGRDVPGFRPRGASEVRRAAIAFLEMKRRVERTIEQRTTMLAGVSHDLRTILTRSKLELALIDDSPEADALRRDVDEMARMLEAYLAFARGDAGEQSAPTDMAAFLEDLKTDAERHGHRASAVFHGQPLVTVRPAAFRRCLANLVSNAARFARSITITGHRDHRWLTITVDDDGPGIPAGMREEVL